MKSKQRILFFSLLIFSFLTRISYICATIPDEIQLTKNQKYNFDKYGLFSPLFSIDVPAEYSGVLRNDGTVKNDRSSKKAGVKLFNAITVKSVNINYEEAEKIIPGGDAIGIKIHADGVEILRASTVETALGKESSPCKNLSLKKGDVIKKVNGENTETITKFTKEIQKSKGNAVTLSVKGEKGLQDVTVNPVLDPNGTYKIGLMVRDSMAGIGTLTYVKPSDNSFGALGHGIEDADTGLLFPMERGTMEQAKIISIEKGRKGAPGQLHGMFSGYKEAGELFKNTDIGVYGKVTEKNYSPENALFPATMSEIKEGKAKIISTIDETGKREFDINIERIIFMNADTSKGMVIHITDPYLLNTTGGIVQGMSGSPIIQNGKLVGAVTHVFVNDPTRGYGIFIENMLSQMN